MVPCLHTLYYPMYQDYYSYYYLLYQDGYSYMDPCLYTLYYSMNQGDCSMCIVFAWMEWFFLRLGLLWKFPCQFSLWNNLERVENLYQSCFIRNHHVRTRFCKSRHVKIFESISATSEPEKSSFIGNKFGTRCLLKETTKTFIPEMLCNFVQIKLCNYKRTEELCCLSLLSLLMLVRRTRIPLHLLHY